MIQEAHNYYPQIPIASEKDRGQLGFGAQRPARAVGAHREQRTQVVNMLMLLVLMLMLLQLWLISLLLQAPVAHGSLGIPAFGASALCFAANLWILKGVHALDRKD
jgi:hypothetical protein